MFTPPVWLHFQTAADTELGARIFARIRSYLSTCQKNGVASEQALRLLYEGRWPDFMGMTPE